MSYFNTSLPISDTTYSSAFPPLQPIPWAINSNNSNSNNNQKKPYSNSYAPSSLSSITGSSINSSGSSHASPLCFFTSLAPPRFPSYLKHTAYADIVLQQYNDRKSKKPTNDLDLRLPQYWNKVIKSRHSIQIGLNGYDLIYNNTGPSNKKETEPTTFHTNFPIRPQCGIYYFEIRVLRRGEDGIFAIGLCRENHKLNKLPGCDSFSYGYHGYDGQTYQKDTKGNQYGPSYSSGDVIGCGINYASNSVFFTKNGVSLGVAFEYIDTSELLYPCVGLSTVGESITANFGQEPFVFDVTQYVKTQKLSSMNETFSSTVLYPDDIQNKYKYDVKADVDQLVLNYLLQQGYTETATSLLKNIQHVKQKDLSNEYKVDEDQLNRNSIRKSIMKGCVDTVIEQTKNMYPGLLEHNSDLLFQLKTRKFLDILIDTSSSSYASDHSSDTDDDTLSTYSGRSRTQSFSSHHDLHGQILYEEEEEEENQQKVNHVPIKPCTFEHITTPPVPVAASGRRLSWAAIAAPPSFDTTVVEEMFTTRRKSISSSSRTRRDSICSIEFEEEDNNLKKMSVIRRAMNYGHLLQEEYQHDSKHLNKLMELFTLLAYNDPKTSPMAHLLELSQRDIVANELNNAIQKYQNHAEDSTLDLIYKQSMVTSKELIYSGSGKASLLNIKSYLSN